jgi:hypothetical protein
VKLQTEHLARPDRVKEEGMKAGGEKLLDLAKKLVKLSAILGVFGYMSLRSHLNYLGISSTSSLGIERYLMETYSLVITTFFPLLSVLLRITAGLLFLYLIAIFITRVLKINEAIGKLKNRLYKYWSSPLGPGLILLTVLSVYGLTQSMIDSYWIYDSIAVGQLQPGLLQESDGRLFYYLSCVICLFGFLVFSAMFKVLKARPDAAGHFLSRGLLVLSAIVILALTLNLPLLYGRLIHPTDYTLAEVIIKDRENQPVCGLLVLNSAAGISLWQAEKGFGRVIEIPRSQIVSLITGGTVDLISMAGEAASDNTLVRPSCSLQPGTPANPAKQ